MEEMPGSYDWTEGDLAVEKLKGLRFAILAPVSLFAPCDQSKCHSQAKGAQGSRTGSHAARTRAFQIIMKRPNRRAVAGTVPADRFSLQGRFRTGSAYHWVRILSAGFPCGVYPVLLISRDSGCHVHQ